VLRTQRPQPEVDFLANSADEAAVRLVQAGGTLLVEPFDIPVGRVAVVADPFGNPPTTTRQCARCTPSPSGTAG
jgi:predicted enzyme related to lactoylglutathione lyase